MSCDVKSCAGCMQNCLLIHGKDRNASSLVNSFFKIMIGDDFSEVMYLPPVFARTVSALLDQKTYLEDSSGRKWEVTVSNVNGSIAFQRGWCAFSLENGLEIGDFLVFHYIMGSHFVVQIYGKSGCPKLNFSKEKINRNKKHKSNDRKSQSRSQTPITGKVSNFGNVKASTTEFTEIPFYMIGRDDGFRQEEDRTPLFDLWNYEMPMKNKCDENVPVKKEETRCDADVIMRSYGNGGLAEENTAVKEVVNRAPFLDVPGIAMVDKSADIRPMDERVFMSTNHYCGGISNGNLQNSAQRINKNSGEETTKVNEEQTQQVDTSEVKYVHEEIIHGIEPKIVEEFVCGHLPVVKAEPVDQIDLPLPVPTTITCLVMEDQTFLELPTRLSWPVQGKSTTSKRVVILRDPNMRLWPVLYQEKCGLKVLTSGWEVFKKANFIRPGDKCVFNLDNEEECIYRVEIFHG